MRPRGRKRIAVARGGDPAGSCPGTSFKVAPSSAERSTSSVVLAGPSYVIAIPEVQESPERPRNAGTAAAVISAHEQMPRSVVSVTVAVQADAAQAGAATRYATGANNQDDDRRTAMQATLAPRTARQADGVAARTKSP
jgi:hypothetical protein